VQPNKECALSLFSFKEAKELVDNGRADPNQVKAWMTRTSRREIDQVGCTIVQHQQVCGVEVTVNNALFVVRIEDFHCALKMLSRVELLTLTLNPPTHLKATKARERFGVHPTVRSRLAPSNPIQLDDAVDETVDAL